MVGVKPRESTSTRRLGPGESVMYTWDDALEKRELWWNCGETKKQKNDLVKVGE